VVFAFTLMALLSLLVYRTRLGRAMRAVANDKAAAQLVGISVDQIIALTFVIGSVLAAAGVPAQGDQSVRLLVDGKKIWIKIPSVQGLTLPGGQDWASLDLEKVSDKFDIKKQADKARSEPIEPIEMNKVGTETLNGEEVTHLKSESTLRDLLGSLSEEQSKQAIEQIEKQDGGKKALDTKVPVEVWVDSSNALHRMTAEISDGETDVAVDLTMKNFGAAVTIDGVGRRAAQRSADLQRERNPGPAAHRHEGRDRVFWQRHGG
jgi:hypothetical protein